MKKKENKEKFFYNIRIIVKIAIVIIAIVSIILAGKFLLYQKQHPQTTYEYYSYKGLPNEASYKLDMLNKLSSFLFLGLLLMCIHIVCDYKISPDTHWANKIKTIIKEVEKYEN